MGQSSVNETLVSFSLDLSAWDIVQGCGGIIAIISILLAGNGGYKNRMWAWGLVIAAHVTIFISGTMLGVEGIYILNIGMISVGIRNIYRDRKQQREISSLEKRIKEEKRVIIHE